MSVAVMLPESGGIIVILDILPPLSHFLSLSVISLVSLFMGLSHVKPNIAKKKSAVEDA